MLCCAGLLYLWQWHQRVPTAETLEGFSRSSIPLVQLLSVEVEGSEFYLWISTPIKFFGMPSEPTVYVFDGRGNLLDWSLEADEWKSIGYYYNERGHSDPIATEEAIKRVNQQAGAN